MAGKFSGRNTFIEIIEETITHFYEVAGQNLQSWTPEAPKVKKEQQDDIPNLEETDTVALILEQDEPEIKTTEHDVTKERAVND